MLLSFGGHVAELCCVGLADVSLAFELVDTLQSERVVLHGHSVGDRSHQSMDVVGCQARRVE